MVIVGESAMADLALCAVAAEESFWVGRGGGGSVNSCDSIPDFAHCTAS